MLVSFVNMTYTAVFDMVTDGTSHTFPVHPSMKCFFKSCVSRMLQVLVIPTNCMVLKSNGDYHFPIFAEDFSVVHKL